MIKAYLVLYNLVSILGWSFVLYLLWSKVSASASIERVFEETKGPLMIVQTAALLEVVHSSLGLVKSPVFTTLMQVTSRLFIVWCIIFPYGSLVNSTSFYMTMVVSWCITEIVRYSYYASALLFKNAPLPLVWARYSLFFLLYPLGAGSEATLVYIISMKLPQGDPIRYACWAALAIYVPGFYTMYTHMAKQRKKYLHSGKSSTSHVKSPPAGKRRVKKD